MRTAKASGFSFIELMASLAIMAVLLSIAVPTARLAVQRHREAELRTGLAQIRTAIDRYKKATEQGKIPVRSGDSGYPPNLAVLVEGVEDATSPDRDRMYFLRRLPRDPFHSDQAIPAEATWGLRSYASPPDAPAEGDDVFDVYSLSSDTGLNGVPYRDW
ncbi:prepilin-type N-terminal cleavage/methylation domain-containing protein [Lysobacter terrae]